MRVLMSGSSGLIGDALCRSLAADGAEIVRLVRRQPSAADERYWDPTAGELEPAVVEGFDVVVNLAGAGIGDKRWSDSRKQLIYDSRIDSTALLVQRLVAAKEQPEVLVSASAIGFYGDRDVPVTETDGPAPPSDFLSSVCVDWEAATVPAAAAGIRTATVRTGLVLAGGGGALARMLLPFKLGFGGKLGSGGTWWSWISIDDHIRAIRHIIDKPVSGPVNLTSPNPVTNARFTKALGKVLHRPTLVPVPKFALDLLLGSELARALLFTSARVLPATLEASGFDFHHPEVETALRAVLD
jgi:hypothetical protein